MIFVLIQDEEEVGSRWKKSQLRYSNRPKATCKQVGALWALTESLYQSWEIPLLQQLNVKMNTTCNK